LAVSGTQFIILSTLGPIAEFIGILARRSAHGNPVYKAVPRRILIKRLT